MGFCWNTHSVAATITAAAHLTMNSLLLLSCWCCPPSSSGTCPVEKMVRTILCTWQAWATCHEHEWQGNGDGTRSNRTLQTSGNLPAPFDFCTAVSFNATLLRCPVLGCNLLLQMD